eukprot:146468_1
MSSESKQQEQDKISQKSFRYYTVGTNNPSELISGLANVYFSEKLMENKKVKLKLFCAVNGLCIDGTKSVLARRLELEQMQRKIILPIVNDEIAAQILRELETKNDDN